MEFGFEGGLIEGEEFEEGGLVKVVAAVGGHEGTLLGESIPRASGEAIVAAVDAVAKGGAEFFGDGAFEFDGEVGDAEAGIELEGGDDGLCGASGDATGAGAAAVGFGGVGVQGECGEDFCEEKPVAESAADEVGVFADEAEAGALGEVAFEDGAGVDVGEGVVLGAGELEEVIGELPEGLGKGVVVVLIAGVAGDEAGGGGCRGRGFGLVGVACS